MVYMKIYQINNIIIYKFLIKYLKFSSLYFLFHNTYTRIYHLYYRVKLYYKYNILNIILNITLNNSKNIK
jgi:hypothetical protein